MSWIDAVHFGLAMQLDTDKYSIAPLEMYVHRLEKNSSVPLCLFVHGQHSFGLFIQLPKLVWGEELCIMFCGGGAV